jgi:transposase
MQEERINLSQRERDRLKVVHAVEEGHLRQTEGAQRLGLSTRQVRRLQVRVRAEGDRGLVHRLRGRASNRKLEARMEKRLLEEVRKRYADFGPTLAAEKLATQGLRVSRETLRQRMIEAGLWKPRRQRVKAVHVWRERRAGLGELVMMDSSPYRWLEERGPELYLIALIDDATSRIWGRFAEHDSTEENFRTLEGWLRRQGRPVALYTDKNSLFVTSRPAGIKEQLRGQPAQTQFGRALGELGIEWIAAQSPQAKGRIENLFGTLQDRLVKEMRLAGVNTLAEANRFLPEVFIPFWEGRFAVAPRQTCDAHRRLEREHRLEQILSVREPRQVAQDYTVRWQGQLWAIPRAEVRAGLRGARIEVERRLDGSLWARFRGSYLSLKPCPAAARRSASPSGLRPPGLADPNKNKTKTQYIPPPDHPWRTFLFGRKPDISTLR